MHGKREKLLVWPAVLIPPIIREGSPPIDSYLLRIAPRAFSLSLLLIPPRYVRRKLSVWTRDYTCTLFLSGQKLLLSFSLRLGDSNGTMARLLVRRLIAPFYPEREGSSLQFDLGSRCGSSIAPLGRAAENSRIETTTPALSALARYSLLAAGLSEPSNALGNRMIFPLSPRFSHC